MERQGTLQVDSRAPLDDGTGRRPRVLVTNDDGIESPGIRELARALAAHYDVLVVAPRENMSGTGTGIGTSVEQGIDIERRDFEGIEAYAVSGPPGLAVMSAALGAFGDRPELVVSGVNAGLNTGHSIIHSGTVGAALTAHTFGSRGIAISLAPSDPWCWQTAMPYALGAVEWALVTTPRCALNVNVPAVAPDEVKGVRWAPLDEFGHFSVATADLGAATLQFDVTDRSSGLDPECDTALVRDGYVTLTLLETVAAAPKPDVSADEVALESQPARRRRDGASLWR